MEEKAPSRARNVTAAIRALGVGEAAIFPIEWMDTVRVITSKVNAIAGGKRLTRQDNEERVIYVERSE